MPRPVCRVGQRVGHRADDGHLEPVEDPDGPEADDDQPVPSGPGQPVQSRWDVGGDASCLDSHECPPFTPRGRPSGGGEARMRVSCRDSYPTDSADQSCGRGTLLAMDRGDVAARIQGTIAAVPRDRATPDGVQPASRRSPSVRRNDHVRRQRFASPTSRGSGPELTRAGPGRPTGRARQIRRRTPRAGAPAVAGPVARCRRRRRDLRSCTTLVDAALLIWPTVPQGTTRR